MVGLLVIGLVACVFALFCISLFEFGVGLVMAWFGRLVDVLLLFCVALWWFVCGLLFCCLMVWVCFAGSLGEFLCCYGVLWLGCLLIYCGVGCLFVFGGLLVGGFRLM